MVDIPDLGPNLNFHKRLLLYGPDLILVPIKLWTFNPGGLQPLEYLGTCHHYSKPLHGCYSIFKSKMYLYVKLLCRGWYQFCTEFWLQAVHNYYFFNFYSKKILFANSFSENNMKKPHFSCPLYNNIKYDK
jgi:hypothetical protein